MADAVAITGIIVSGVVGPGLGALYATRRLEREHDFDRVAGDRAEVRDLLDGAAQRLGRCGRLQGGFDGLFLVHGRSLAIAAKHHTDIYHEVAREFDLDQSRLQLRFGPEHELVTSADAAFRALTTTSQAVGLAGDVSLKETKAALDAAVASRAEAEQRFMAAARAIAASQLQPGQRGRWWRRLLRR